jgi:Zn-dependent protease
VLGIEVGVDFSWFIALFLITWSLAAGYFPLTTGSWSSPVTWLLAGVTSLLFFASVLAHELGHSVVAIATGVPVRSITLFIFGGVAQIAREPRRALDEFLIASAGPAVSFVLGVGFGLFWLAGLLLDLRSLVAVGKYLTLMNFGLVLFNLIPGFPLDGGRVFRSLVWGATGNLAQATQVASRIGQGVAFLLIFAGLWVAFSVHWVSGLWLAFIGWFLQNAAMSSYQQVALRQMLRGHTARDVMTRDWPRVSRRLSLDRLVDDVILRTGRRCFPVVDEGRVWGIVTLHHVKKVPRTRWPVTSVAQVMTPFAQVKRVHPDEDLYEVLERMTVEDVNQMPVVAEGRLLGLVARDAVLSFIRARAELGI